MSFNEVICLITWCSHYWYFQCDSLSVRVRFIVQCHISGIFLAHFFLTFWLGSVIGLFLPSSTSSLNTLLWVCDCVGGTAVGPCFLDRTQASRRCWRGLVWTSTRTLRVLQPPTHFPLSWWQLVWPLKTEQNSLKIDKPRLVCTEPDWDCFSLGHTELHESAGPWSRLTPTRYSLKHKCEKVPLCNIC